MAPSRKLPDRLYYRIGEISRYTGLEPYVLRYWETEFEQLAPQKSGSRQRLYRREDVDLILRLKELLHEEGFTIEGAKKYLARKRARAADRNGLPDGIRDELRAVRKELASVIDMLKDS